MVTDILEPNIYDAGRPKGNLIPRANKTCLPQAAHIVYSV